jgi:hypothetical protein
MVRSAIHCKGCGKRWPAAPNQSVYERQAIESRPCPTCAAYTLSVLDAPEERPLRRQMPSVRRIRKRRPPDRATVHVQRQELYRPFKPAGRKTDLEISAAG